MTMWNAPRNRRRHRQSLLDVKLSLGEIRRARWVVASRLGGVLLGAALLFFGVWRGGEWLLQRLFYNNGAFAIRTVDLRTDGRLSEAQLHAWADVKPGENLFGLDLLRVKRNLEAVPAISSAAVDRVLPDTLRVRVVERRPVAQVLVYRRRAEGDYVRLLYQMDGDGYVMEPSPAPEQLSQGVSWLPLFTGIEPGLLLPGRAVHQPQVHAALELLQQFDRSPMAGLVQLQQVEVSAPLTLMVRTWQGAEVTLGLTQLDRQLRRWRFIHDYGREHRRVPATLDLSIKNNLPVRWQEPGSPPAPVPAKGPARAAARPRPNV